MGLNWVILSNIGKWSYGVMVLKLNCNHDLNNSMFALGQAKYRDGVFWYGLIYTFILCYYLNIIRLNYYI